MSKWLCTKAQGCVFCECEEWREGCILPHCGWEMPTVCPWFSYGAFVVICRFYYSQWWISPVPWISVFKKAVLCGSHGDQWVRFLSIETWHTFTQVPLLKWEISRKKITIPKYLLINRFNFNPLGSRNWYFSVGDTGPRLELPIYSFIYLSIGCFVWIFRCSLRASFCTLTHVCIFLVVILKNHIQAPTRSCI